jgi:hypothetical protein
MEKDAPGRTGMTWQSLAKHANRACDTMRARFFAGGFKNTHLKDYIIEVVDRSTTAPNVSWIYQFVADDFAFDILAERKTGAQKTTLERFTDNCTIITEWLDQSKDILNQLPNEFRLTRQENRGRKFISKSSRQAVFENVKALTSITNTIRDIEIRLNGTGDPRTLRHKPAQLDPVGALNHQLRLGHMIRRLKEELTVYDAPTEGHTEEITPFE